MAIPTISLQNCTAEFLLPALTSGAFILTDVLEKELVQSIHEEARSSLQPFGYALRQPFDPNTRTGYTPVGVEGTVRTGANYSRHFFDYRPGITALHPSYDILGPIHEELVKTGLHLLGLFDLAAGKDVYPIAKGGRHLLRIAECLNESIDPGTELFPAHIDFSILTLFLGGTTPGLEIEREGEWVKAEPAAGDVLVGTGSIFRQYVPQAASLRHRIMMSAARRLSFFFFLEPDPEVALPSGEKAGEFLTRILSTVRTDH